MNTPSHRVPAWLRGARVRLVRVAARRGEPRFHWCSLVDALERGLKAVRVAGDRPVARHRGATQLLCGTERGTGPVRDEESLKNQHITGAGVEARIDRDQMTAETVGQPVPHKRPGSTRQVDTPSPEFQGRRRRAPTGAESPTIDDMRFEQRVSTAIDEVGAATNRSPRARDLPNVKERPANDTMVNQIVAGIRDGWTDRELYKLTMSGIARHFRQAGEETRRHLLATRPELTATAWDALIAAVVEHVAALHGYQSPEWVSEPERFWIPPRPIAMYRKLDTKSVMERIGKAPAAFLRHGIIADPRDLDERGGELVNWSQGP